MNKDAEIRFVETAERDLRNYTLIEGFPGMGLVGTIGAKYLVEKLGFDEIGYIDMDVFAPIIRIHEGLPVHPSRIYANEKQKLVVLLSEQIIPRNVTEKLARGIVEWIAEKRIKRVISLAGISLEDSENKDKIYGIAANPKSKEILKKYKIETIRDGITTGVTALILLNLKDSNIEAFSILGNAQLQADYKGAAQLLKKLNEIIGLDISVDPLLKEAKETEKDLLRHLDNMKKTHETVQKLEGKAPMYT